MGSPWCCVLPFPSHCASSLQMALCRGRTAHAPRPARLQHTSSLVRPTITQHSPQRVHANSPLAAPARLASALSANLPEPLCPAGRHSYHGKPSIFPSPLQPPVSGAVRLGPRWSPRAEAYRRGRWGKDQRWFADQRLCRTPSLVSRACCCSCLNKQAAG